jgi:cytoskeleton protein RodZ
MATRLGSDDPLQIGAILEDARRRQGIDIETLAERTKIRPKYLRALENEDWEALPGPAYARGFIRAYAKQLGIDSEVLVDEYRQRHETPTGTYEHAEPVLRGGWRERARRRLLPRRWILAAIVAEVAILLLILGLTARDDDDGASGRQGAAQERQRDGSGGGDKRGDGGGKQGAAKPRSEATMKLVIRSDLQACVVDGGGRVLVPDQLLTGGTEDGPYVARRFKVELDPADARIMINGEPARAADPSGDAAAYSVSSAGARRANYTGKLCGRTK